MKAVGTLTKMLPVVVALCISLFPGLAKADPGTNYCVKPAFISGNKSPNLLMIIDNSASMFDMAYMSGATSTSTGACTLPAGASCYDNSYDDTKDYDGYFSKINTSTIPMSISYPIYQYSGGKFVEVTAFPATTGTYHTSYLDVAMTGVSGSTTNPRVVTSFTASGRFLNWLASSKFDVEKKILTGGKYSSSLQGLIGETRGCNGRRFVKALSVLPGITFAVRGPNKVELNYNPSTQGGESRIEIYEGMYNQDACQCAVYNWANGSYGQASTDTKSCLATTNADSSLTALNHAQQVCWVVKKNIANDIKNNVKTTDATIWQGFGTNPVQDLETDCGNMYKASKNPILPSALTDKTLGNYVCTSVATHGAIPSPYSVDDVNGPPNTTGFLGECWNSATGWDNACAKREMLHYCYGVNFTEVTDPSSSTTAGTGNIPAVLTDAGVRAIGDPVGPSGSTDTFFYAKAGISAPPAGVINDFADKIRFGAMQFNYAGSASECGGTSKVPCPQFCGGDINGTICTSDNDCPAGVSCVTVTNKDGSKIISYVGAGKCSITTTTACDVDRECPAGEYCKPSVGDHASGLISSIDGINASSWTPFAEAYYNAIAYFTKDATTTNPNLDATLFTPATSSITAPLNSADFNSSKNPIQFRCQLNNILLITDGASTADQNSTMTGKVTDTSGVFRDPTTTSEPTTCGNYLGSPYLHDLSYFAQHRNIFDPSKVCPAPANSNYSCETAQTIKTYAVYTGPVSTATDMCDANAQLNQTAVDGGTTLQTPADPIAFRTALRDALQKIAAGAASGTAASILSNSEGSGANILQAVFYPSKIFENMTYANWIGEMQNLWYYVDPYINNSTIREDTDYTGSGTHDLNLVNDNIAVFKFDTSSDKTMVQLYQDTNGDGAPDTVIPGLIDPDYLKSVWRAGRLLWARDITSTPRNILTSIDGASLTQFSSASANASTLAPYLNVAGTDAPALINWVHGQDQTGYRNRTVAIKDPSTNIISQHVWKLGDIISSTPRIQSNVALNTYHLSPSGGYNDTSYLAYIKSSNYQKRGMVYVGANDGMMHAFRLGDLSVMSSGFVKATLSGTDLGKEEWAYIPKNALPYLKYMSDPSYDHLYSVDGRTTLLDASIGSDGSATPYYDQTKTMNSWRTVVIGAMGTGGASRNAGDTTCTEGATGTCVKTPVNGVGYSSYFALDVTNQIFDPSNPLPNPTFLWEFSDPALGFATSGPAIVRVGDKSTNGRWFAVFGSGPTGPIDTATNQFLGTSNQQLRFFVVDLNATPPLTLNTNYWIIDKFADGTPLPANAFVGSMIGGSMDSERGNPNDGGYYQDDVIYAGYVKKPAGGTDWNKGGVIRITINKDPVMANWKNPATWVASSVIGDQDDIGPVTTSIARLQDNKNGNLWLYFGTGRFYWRNTSALDDYSDTQSLYGIKEPCYNNTAVPGAHINPNCTDSIASSQLVPQTTADLFGNFSAVGASNAGWRIDLAGSTSTQGAERVITDTTALTNGTVFFTSFKPTTDFCGYGGNSFLWAVKYDTGGNAASNALQGKALIQLSTGEFKEITLQDVFSGGSRSTSAGAGKPPTDPISIVTSSNNRPVKKILHIREH